MVTLDDKIWASGFRFGLLKFKYIFKIILKSEGFGFDKSTKGFKVLKALNIF